MVIEKKSNSKLERALLPKEWDDALCSLQGHERVGLGWQVSGKYDSKPLSKLLMSDRPVPKKVTEIIGRLLNPPSGYIGGRLNYRKPGKKALNLHETERRREKALLALQKKVDEGLLAKSVIDEIAAEYRFSRSTLEKLNKASIRSRAKKIAAWFDPDTGLP